MRRNLIIIPQQKVAQNRHHKIRPYRHAHHYQDVFNHGLPGLVAKESSNVPQNFSHPRRFLSAVVRNEIANRHILTDLTV
jgi:hypothetical protein